MTGSRSDLQMVCVVAMARNRVIGDGSDLIWHLPGDLKRVKELTMGCPLIMGRRTWESIGRALPGRLSIVLTRNSGWSAPEALRLNLPFLGAIPLHMDIRATSDAGTPIVANQPNSPHAKIYQEIAQKILDQLAKAKRAAPKLVME